MIIDEKMLSEERKVLEVDFNATSDKIKQFEKDLGQMKSNLNALYGAIQQIDKLINKIKNIRTIKKMGPKMPSTKEKALNIATS